MQKMHKYMQRCKITTQTMTNFAVIILLTTTRHIHSSKHNNLTVSKSVCRENRSKTSTSSFKFTERDLHCTSCTRTSEIPQSFVLGPGCVQFSGTIPTYFSAMSQRHMVHEDQPYFFDFLHARMSKISLFLHS